MNTLKEKLSIAAITLSLIGISSTKNPVMLILAYLIHEIGHVTFAKLVGAKIIKMRGGVFHLSISYSSYNMSYGKEMLVCSGGIVFNLLFAVMTYVINRGNNDTLSTFFLINLSLALMNLYPVSILDGGGILRAFLFMKIREDVAEKISLFVSFGFALILWLIAVYLQIIFAPNISLFFISVMLLVTLCFSI